MADDNKPIHELRFDAAVQVIQSLPADGKNIRKTCSLILLINAE